jgi:hypothetical protein
MTDHITGFDQIEEGVLPDYEISDEALEIAAGIEKAQAFTLAACTHITVCPGP